MVRSSGVRIDFRPFDRNQVCSFRSEDTHDVWSQPDAVGTLTTVGVPTLGRPPNLISYDSYVNRLLRLNKPDIKLPVFNKPETLPDNAGYKLFGVPVLKKPEIWPLTPFTRFDVWAVFPKPEVKPFSAPPLSVL